MYAVVAPGISGVYYNWKDVERIHALYPFAKWSKCFNEQDAREFIKRNTSKHIVKQLYNYGDTLKDLYVDAKYRIGEDCLFVVLDTKRIGHLRIPREDVIIEYKGSKIFIRVPNTYLSDTTISSHMSAIHTILELVGGFIDVNIELPNFSIFYALTAYKGKRSRAITLTQEMILRRTCKVAYTLKMRNIGDYKEEDITYDGD